MPITLSSASPTGLKVDAIVIGVASSDDGPILLPGSEPVDEALGGSLAATLTAVGVTGKADEVTKLPTLGNTTAQVVLATGVGPWNDEGGAEADALARREAIRRAAGAAARALAGTESAAFTLPLDDAADAAAIADGILLGAYDYTQYKSENGKKPLDSATIIGPGVKAKAVREAVARSEAISAAVNQARDWVNMPPRDLTPKAFADAATKFAKARGKVSVEVLDEKALAKGGYGGLIGVGQGSVNPPRLLRIAYRPTKAAKHVALVGKGITFDSGGLSLKPNDGMVTMKCDMGGAAAVVAAVAAIAELATDVAVTAYAAMAENMPSGTAQRPSDVITIYGGKTVEVLNTDAEGRLVMADALARANEDEPDLIVDVATLTGGAVIALGNRLSAIMANDDALLTEVGDAAQQAGEQMWPLPLPDELREKLDSQIADIANVGDRWGGTLQAGVFLREFVANGIDWAHLDIAGPAFNEGAPYGYTPKGGTGAAVRTLVQLVERL